MKRLYFTVTNDLTYDQRMQRICGSLQRAGYTVTLVGRTRKNSRPLVPASYQQVRLSCFFDKGAAFYAEYNLRLFFFLLFQKMDAVCAIDLDTILPCLFVSRLRNCLRVYDAHEYFTEMVELRRRPRVQRFWKKVERLALPRFRNNYTVSEGLAELFQNEYGQHWEVIRNLPVRRPLHPVEKSAPFLVVTGAVNEGRAFEYLIPAMKWVPWPLVICGDGNFMAEVRARIAQEGVADKIELRGMVPPEELWTITRQATAGLALAVPEGAHSWHALPNKFLDYIQAGLPQVTMDYPEYRRVNDRYRVALLIDSLEPRAIAEQVNRLMGDAALREELARNCLLAREELCWEKEEEKLVRFYHELFAR